MPRGLIPSLIFAFTAILFFGLGNLLAARQTATSESEQLAALRAEVGALKRQSPVSGTSGRIEPAPDAKMDDHSRAAIVADIKHQLKTEMGLLPITLLRERRKSFVELY